MTLATTSLAIVLLPRLSSSLGAQRSEASRSSDKEPNSPVIVSDAASDHDSSMEMPTSLDMDSTQTSTMSESSLLEASTSQPEEQSSMSQTTVPQPPDGETTQTSQPTQRPALRQNAYNVPKRKKKLNKSEEMVKTMSTLLVDQLRDMNNAMQLQEEQRQERFIAAEREMQQSFLNQIASMQERLSRESQNVQMALIERLMGRPQYQTPNRDQYATGQSYYDPAATPSNASPEFSIYRTLP